MKTCSAVNELLRSKPILSLILFMGVDTLSTSNWTGKRFSKFCISEHSVCFEQLPFTQFVCASRCCDFWRTIDSSQY